MHNVIHRSEARPRQDYCGSIRELINLGRKAKLSLAIASIKPGRSSAQHYHKRMDETYFVLKGSGVLSLGGKTRKLREGHAVFIPSNTWHRVRNSGRKVLELLVHNSPSYSRGDHYIK